MPEILDRLPNHHPAAMRSRRDLRRVHRAMGTRRILVHAFQALQLPTRSPKSLRILEIGAGDGNLMRGVAQRLHSQWRSVELTLLDQVNLVDASTISEYAALGWQVKPMITDVLAWAGAAAVPETSKKPWDLIIANLFLHHFEGAQLTGLLSAIGMRTDCFFACEPRRSFVANLASHLIGALGVNAVTRADAVTSVRAGFRHSEIGSLWPTNVGRWTVKEYPAGLFSHCFLAKRLITETATEAPHAA